MKLGVKISRSQGGSQTVKRDLKGNKNRSVNRYNVSLLSLSVGAILYHCYYYIGLLPLKTIRNNIFNLL